MSGTRIWQDASARVLSRKWPMGVGLPNIYRLRRKSPSVNSALPLSVAANDGASFAPSAGQGRGDWIAAEAGQW